MSYRLSSAGLVGAVSAGADQTIRWLKSRIDDLRRAGDAAVPLVAVAAVFAALFVILMARFFTPSPPELTRISYSAFKQNLDKVAEVSTTGRNIDGKMKTPIKLSGVEGTVLSFTTLIPTSGDGDLEAQLEKYKVTIDDPKITFNWDIVQSATPFATLAAILAMLTFPPNAGDKGKRYAPLVPFLAAFFTLILAAFLFSVLAGLGSSGGNRLLPLAEGYFLSWIFGCGVVQTCVGMAFLMEDYQTTVDVKPVRRTARWIVHLGVVLAAVATSGVLVQPLFVLYPDQGVEGTVAWILMGILPMLAIPIGAAFRRSRIIDNLRDTTYVAIAMVLIVTFLYGIASAMTEQEIRASYGAQFI